MDLKGLNLEELSTIEKISIDGGDYGDAAEAIGYFFGLMCSKSFWEGWVIDTFHS
jgi:hypothetical protein